MRKERAKWKWSDMECFALWTAAVLQLVRRSEVLSVEVCLPCSFRTDVAIR